MTLFFTFLWGNNTLMEFPMLKPGKNFSILETTNHYKNVLFYLDGDIKLYLREANISQWSLLLLTSLRNTILTSNKKGSNYNLKRENNLIKVYPAYLRRAYFSYLLYTIIAKKWMFFFHARTLFREFFRTV